MWSKQCRGPRYIYKDSFIEVPHGMDHLAFAKEYLKMNVSEQNYVQIIAESAFVRINSIVDTMGNVIMFVYYEESFKNTKKFYTDILDIISKHKVRYMFVQTDKISAMMTINEFLEMIPKLERL